MNRIDAFFCCRHAETFVGRLDCPRCAEDGARALPATPPAAVVSLAAAVRRLPPETPQALRDLADKIERGECTDLVWCAVVHGNYEFNSASSLTQSLLLSDLLHDWSMRRMRGEIL